MSDSLWLHGLKHDSLPCPSLSPRVSSDLCPLSWWCDLTISSCHPLLLLPSIFPNIKIFSNESVLCCVQHIATWASVLPVNIQGWFPLGLTGLISLLSKGLSRIFSSTTLWKHQCLALSLLYGPALTYVYDYWKNHSFDYLDFCQQSDVSDF